MTQAIGIAAAATRYNGKLYIGEDHLAIYEYQIRRDQGGVIYSTCIPGEGFVTAEGRFLTRIEAKQIADGLGVVRSDRDRFRGPELYTDFLAYGTITPASVMHARNALKRPLALVT